MIPKIKRDETNTKITNRDEIINYIMFYIDINNDTLPKYKDALLSQNKVSINEVQGIIDAIDYKIELFKKYKESTNDQKTLEQFFKENLNYIKQCFKELKTNTSLNNEVEDLLINFLNYCIKNEENGIQNTVDEQNIFNDYKYEFDKLKSNNAITDNSFHSKVIDIINRKDNLINRVDLSADFYKDNDYLSNTQLFSNLNNNLENNNNGRYSGFILTSIILEASLVISLILSLLAIFKR